MKYRTTVELPEDFRAFIQAITTVAEIEDGLDAPSTNLTIVVEAEDEYELASTIHFLNEELWSIRPHINPVERPILVEE